MRNSVHAEHSHSRLLNLSSDATYPNSWTIAFAPKLSLHQAPCDTSLRKTVSSPVVPLMTSAPSLANSIQPSLKPSSIRTRGCGYFMPCDLNRLTQVARGTTCALTERPRIFAKVAATSLGVTRCSASSSTTRCDRGDHRNRLIQWLQKTRDQAFVAINWRVEQGVDMGRASVLLGRTQKRGGIVRAVHIAGRAVPVMRGWLNVPTHLICPA